MGLKYIDTLTIDSPGTEPRVLQLCMGDVTDMGSNDQIDFLVVSALPDDYSPVSGSVIAGLSQKGISVDMLSKNKAADYEPVMPCWISQPVTSSSSGIEFKRILLFEPADPASSAQGLLPDVFTALSCFNGVKNTTVAIPMMCTGSGGADLAKIFYGLFYAAAFGQSSASFPLSVVKLVVRDQAQLNKVQPLFTAFKQDYTNIQNLDLPGDYNMYAKSCWDWAQAASLPPYITRRQAFGIRLYTSNYYGQLNALLRANDPNDPVYMKTMPVFDAINAGLHNLQSSSGMTYRGEMSMSPDRLNEWVKGNDITNLAYTSTARPAGTWYNSAAYKFKINGIQCKSISFYSEFPSENEFLYAPGLIQHVTSRICDAGNTYCTFAADEVVINWCNQ